MDEDILDDEDRGDLIEDDETDIEETLEEEDESDIEETEEEEIEEDDEVDEPSAEVAELIRLNEESRQRTTWLEDQLAKLISSASSPKEAPSQKPTFDFTSAEEQYANLLIEGEHKEAAKLRVTIDGARREEMIALMADIKKSATEEASKSTSEAMEAATFKTTITSIERDNPYLNAKSKLYNEEAVDTVNALSSGYIAAGMNRSEALLKAVAKVNSFYKPDTPSALGSKRKSEAGKKAAKASAAQPARTKSAASPDTGTTTSIFKMSDRDLSKLTLKELKALRGD